MSAAEPVPIVTYMLLSKKAAAGNSAADNAELLVRMALENVDYWVAGAPNQAWVRLAYAQHWGDMRNIVRFAKDSLEQCSDFEAMQAWKLDMITWPGCETWSTVLVVSFDGSDPDATDPRYWPEFTGMSPCRSFTLNDSVEVLNIYANSK